MVEGGDGGGGPVGDEVPAVIPLDHKTPGVGAQHVHPGVAGLGGIEGQPEGAARLCAHNGVAGVGGSGDAGPGNGSVASVVGRRQKIRQHQGRVGGPGGEAGSRVVERATPQEGGKAHVELGRADPKHAVGHAREGVAVADALGGEGCLQPGIHALPGGAQVVGLIDAPVVHLLVVEIDGLDGVNGAVPPDALDEHVSGQGHHVGDEPATSVAPIQDGQAGAVGGQGELAVGGGLGGVVEGSAGGESPVLPGEVFHASSRVSWTSTARPAAIQRTSCREPGTM